MPASKKNPPVWRDGIEVVDDKTGEVIHFVECDYEGRMRDKVKDGLAQKIDWDRFHMRDTRDAKASS